MYYHNFSKLNLFLSLFHALLHGWNVEIFNSFLWITCNRINLQLDMIYWLVWFDWDVLYITGVYLELSRTSTAEFFCENSKRLLAVNYFYRKAPSSMFGWVLKILLCYFQQTKSTRKPDCQKDLIGFIDNTAPNTETLTFKNAYLHAKNQNDHIINSVYIIT